MLQEKTGFRPPERDKKNPAEIISRVSVYELVVL